MVNSEHLRPLGETKAVVNTVLIAAGKRIEEQVKKFVDPIRDQLPPLITLQSGPVYPIMNRGGTEQRSVEYDTIHHCISITDNIVYSDEVPSSHISRVSNDIAWVQFGSIILNKIGEELQRESHDGNTK